MHVNQGQDAFVPLKTDREVPDTGHPALLYDFFWRAMLPHGREGKAGRTPRRGVSRTRGSASHKR
jgi:hypothetical protein